MKSLKALFSILLATALMFGFVSCSSDGDGTTNKNTASSTDPFAGTAWYGDTITFSGESLTDVELLHFLTEKFNINGTVYGKVEIVNDIYFPNKNDDGNGLMLTSGNTINYTVAKNGAGYVASISLLGLEYAEFAIASSNATTGICTCKSNVGAFSSEEVPSPEDVNPITLTRK